MYLDHFSVDYSIAADLDYFIKIADKDNLCVTIKDKIIVSISEDGISSRKIKLKLAEVKKIYKQHFGQLWILSIIARYIKKLIDRNKMTNMINS